MSERIIDFLLPPYDEGSVLAAHLAGQCPGVGVWFTANPILPGDLVLLDGVLHRVRGVVVECQGTPVYVSGATQPPGLPITHHYTESPVSVEMWLEPIVPQAIP